MNDATRAIAEVVERWRARYEACDAAGLKALWDQQHRPLTYLPTEQEAALREWQQISDYYDHITAALLVNEWRTWDLIVDVTSDSTAFAVARTGFTYRPRGAADGAEGYWEGRASFGLHRTDDGWKLIHYEDSTLMHWAAPLVAALQQPQLARIEQGIAEGNTAAVLAAVQQLGKPLNFGALFAVAKPTWGTVPAAR